MVSLPCLRYGDALPGIIGQQIDPLSPIHSLPFEADQPSFYILQLASYR